VTQTIQDVVLTRPEGAANPGPLDDRFYDLVESRFRRIIRDNPLFGTYLGIHTEDHRLGDGSRDAVLGELADEKAHLAASMRSTRPACRPRLDSSAISSSTTSAAGSSTPRSFAPGSDGRRPSTSSATRCS